VLSAQASLADVQGALVQGAGGVEVALVAQDGGEVADEPGDGPGSSWPSRDGCWSTERLW
jgi:hypothetical protein